jgi:hypothetical protein
MAIRFTFTVTVELQHEQGKFAPRDEIAEQLLESLNDADPMTLYGLGADSDSTYNTVSWETEEA